MPKSMRRGRLCCVPGTVPTCRPRAAAARLRGCSAPLQLALWRCASSRPLTRRAPAGAQEVIDLSEEQQAQMWREVGAASKALSKCMRPDKLNIAAIGNQARCTAPFSPAYLGRVG